MHVCMHVRFDTVLCPHCPQVLVCQVQSEAWSEACVAATRNILIRNSTWEANHAAMNGGGVSIKYVQAFVHAC